MCVCVCGQLTVPVMICYPFCTCCAFTTVCLKPSTHCRRDTTVGLSRVKVLTRCAVCIELAASSRRLPTDLAENLETEHVENLSCQVELCRRCVRSHWLLRPSLPFCSHTIMLAGGECDNRGNYRQSPDKGTQALAINLPVYSQVLHSKQTPIF